MGVVAKQSVLNMLVTYLGFAFGALNTLFLFTHILSSEDYGIVSYLLASANLLWPVLVLGANHTLIKFGGAYTSLTAKNILFTKIVMVPIFVWSVLVILFFALKSFIFQKYLSSNPALIDYIWLIGVIGLCTAYFEIFYAWSKVHLKSILGNLLKELYHRVGITLLLILVYLDYCTAHEAIYALSLLFFTRTLLMFFVVCRIQKPKLIWKPLENTRTIVSYSLLILLAATVSVFLVDLDKLMIEDFMPVRNVAIYSICVYMAAVVEVPTRAMHQITHPLTAKLMAAPIDYVALNTLNKKTAFTAFIVVSWIAILIIFNVEDLFRLIPSHYELHFLVVFLMCLVKAFNASMGITNSLVFNSDSYVWILAFGVCVFVLAYFLNIYFIPIYGLDGATIATFISYSLYNIARLIFVYSKFGIHPYSIKVFWVLVVSLLIGVSFYSYFPKLTVYPLLQVSFRAFFLSIVYWGVIYSLGYFSPFKALLLAKRKG